MTLNVIVITIVISIIYQDYKMSRMSDISIEIQERLEYGEDPKYIAKTMNIPIHWVYAAIAFDEFYYEEYDPYNTLNS